MRGFRSFHLLLGFLLGVTHPAYALETLTVIADSATGVALAGITREYSRETQIVVNTSFAPSLQQAQQITDGEAADILITPKQSWIDELKAQGLIDVYSQTVIARDQLALVGPESSKLQVDMDTSFPISDLIIQMGGEQAFVLGNPETQLCGIFGKEALRSLDVMDELEPYTLYIKQLDQILEMITQQNAYAVILNSTAEHRRGIRILDIFPESSHKPIVYYAVVLAGDNMTNARKFLDYLKSEKAREIFKRSGFIMELTKPTAN